MVKTTNAAADTFVRLEVRRAQYEFQCMVVMGEAGAPFPPPGTTLRRNTNRRRREMPTVPIAKNGEGSPKQHDVSRGILACGGPSRWRIWEGCAVQTSGGTGSPARDAGPGLGSPARLGVVIARRLKIASMASLCACRPNVNGSSGLRTASAWREERIIRATAGKQSGYVERRLWSHHGLDGQCRELLFLRHRGSPKRVHVGAQDDIEPVDTSDELINGSRVGGR